MKREDFVNSVAEMVGVYIDNALSFDSNPQLRVNPRSMAATIVNGADMLAEIDRSIENVEAAAGADGAAVEADTDYQASRNPDFYAVSRLVEKTGQKRVPSMKAIESVADVYFK